MTKTSFWKKGTAMLLAVIMVCGLGMAVYADDAKAILGFGGHEETLAYGGGEEDVTLPAQIEATVEGAAEGETKTVLVDVSWQPRAAFDSAAGAVNVYDGTPGIPDGYSWDTNAVQQPVATVTVGVPAAEPTPEPAPVPTPAPVANPEIVTAQSGLLRAGGENLSNARFDGEPEVLLNGTPVVGGAQIEIKNGDTVTMNYTWAQHDTEKKIMVDDYTYLGTIPGTLPVADDFGSVRQPVKTLEGVTIGTLSFEYVDGGTPATSYWNVRLTYTEGATRLQDLQGTLSIESNISVEVEPGKSYEIDFGESLKVEFIIKDTTIGTSELSKAFSQYYNGEDALGSEASAALSATHIEWSIELNTNRVAVYDGTLVDTLTAKMVFDDPVSLEVYRLDSEGNVAATLTEGEANGEDAVAPTYSFTRNSGTRFTLSLGSITSAYRVVVRAQMNPALAGQEGTVTYSNSAAFNGLTKSASKSVTLPKGYAKEAGGITKIDGNYYITWNLYINRQNASYGGDITVNDVFGGGLKLLTGGQINNNSLVAGGNVSVFEAYEITYDAATGTASVGTTNLVPAASFGNINWLGAGIGKPAATADGVSFTVPDGKGYKVVIRTLVDGEDGLYQLRTGGIRNDFTATVNGAKKGEGTATQSSNNTAGGTLGVAKENWTGARDTVNQLLGWGLKIDLTSGYTVSDLVITDTFTYGANGETHKLVSDSIEMYFGTAAGGNAIDWKDFFAITSSDTGGFVLTQKSGATLVPGATTSNGSTYNGSLYVRYKTNYTLGTENDSTVKTGTFKNTFDAAGKLTAGGKTYNASGSSGTVTQTIYGDARLSGSKTAQLLYDTENKNYYVNWTVNFNTDYADLTGHEITLTDTFDSGGGMVFHGDKDDLLVEQLVSGSWVKMNRGQDYTLDTVMLNNNTGFTLVLKAAVKSQVRVSYRTDLREPLSFSYTNKVTFATGDKSLDKEAAVTLERADEGLLFKDVASDPETPGSYIWTVDLNADKHEIRNAVFSDTLSKGLILDKSSIEVLYGSTATSGTPGQAYAGEYKIEGGDRDAATATTNFHIVFAEPVTDHFIITYKAAFDSATAERDPQSGAGKLSNSARITGDGYDKWTEKVTYRAFTSVTGGGKGSLLSMRIEKFDGATNQRLAGAVFQIYDLEGNPVGGEIYLSDEGKSNDFTLLGGRYQLVEVEAPAGYQALAPTEFDVSVNDRGDDGVIAIRVDNYPIPPTATYSLQVRKTDADTGAALSGAVFDVRLGGRSIGSITVGANGIGRFPSLMNPGTYTLVETKAPGGYALDATPRTVVVSAANADRNNVVSITVTNRRTDGPAPDPDPEDPPVPPVVPLVPLVVVPVIGPPGGGGGGAAAIVPVIGGGGGGGAQTEPIEGTETPTTNLDPGGIPQGGLDSVAWSLLNLIMAIIALFASITLLVTLFRRRRTNEARRGDQDEDEAEQENEKARRNRLIALRLPAIVAGLIPAILFLLLENIRLPMTWITQWTPLIGAFFIISMILVIVHFVVTRRARDDDDRDDDVPTDYSRQSV